jgi:beta-lactamase regulating signal transducer with metallopeptidase domain
MDTLTTLLSEQTIERIGWVLVHFLWQGIAVAAVGWCVMKMLGKASSNTRYIAACIGLVLMAAAPVVTYSMLGGAAVVVAEPVAQRPVSIITDPVPAATRTIIIAPLEPTALPERSMLETLIGQLEVALPYCVIGWIVGVAVLSVWYLGGWCQLQKLRRIGTKAVSDCVEANASLLSQRLGLRRAVGIVESALVQVPTVIGWLKPVILLPATALTGLDETQLRAMIAHELAHIKRCDYLINIAQTVVEILGFYHPAIWWMSRQIRVERENCCDDMAIELVQNRKEYAKALFSMEEIRTQQRNLAVAANGGHLQSRIGRLIGKNTSQHQKSGWVPSIFALITIVVLLGSTFAFNSVLAEDETSQVPDKQKIAEFFKELHRTTQSGDIQAILPYLYFENDAIKQKALPYLPDMLGDFWVLKAFIFSMFLYCRIILMRLLLYMPQLPRGICLIHFCLSSKKIDTN